MAWILKQEKEMKKPLITLTKEQADKLYDMIIPKGRPITETHITPLTIAHRTHYPDNCDKIADQIYERYCGPAPRTPTAEEKRIALLTGLLNWRKITAESVTQKTPEKPT
jgi:hypothetical protein